MLMSCYMQTSLVFLRQGNVKKFEKLMKIVNIEEKNLQIYWTSSGISMKFSGKLSLVIILKITKNQDSTLSLKHTFLGKPHEG